MYIADQLMHVAAVLSEEPVFDDTYSYTPARAFSYDMEGNYQGGWGYIPKVGCADTPCHSLTEKETCMPLH